MSSLSVFASAIDTAHRRLAYGVAGLLLVMVLVGAGNALARAFEGDLGIRLSSNAWLELQWYLFGIVFLLAAPDALRVGAHVRVDLVYGGHATKAKAWIDLCGAVFLLIPFCVFAVWTSIPFVWNSIRTWEMSGDPGGLMRWPLKPVIPIAFALLGLQGAAEAIRAAAKIRDASDDSNGESAVGA